MKHTLTLTAVIFIASVGIAFAQSQNVRSLNFNNDDPAATTRKSITIKAPALATLTTNLTWILPGTLPAANQILSVSSVSGSTATLDWVNNASSFPAVFVTASYIVAATDYYIIVKPTASTTVDITLPLASANTGRVISISNFANPSPTTVNIKSTSFAQLKIGYGAVQSSVVLTANNSTTTISSGAGKSTWISDGSLWYQIGL